MNQGISSSSRSLRMAALKLAPDIFNRKGVSFHDGILGEDRTGEISAMGRPWRKTITCSPFSTSSNKWDAFFRKSVKDTVFMSHISDILYITVQNIGLAVNPGLAEIGFGYSFFDCAGPAHVTSMVPNRRTVAPHHCRNVRCSSGQIIMAIT